jgi:plasmid maintenance system antidote protein VapI
MELLATKPQQPYEKMREYIKERGIAFTFLAKKAGYSKSHICELMKGVKRMSEEQRQTFNEILGTDY